MPTREHLIKGGGGAAALLIAAVGAWEFAHHNDHDTDRIFPTYGPPAPTHDIEKTILTPSVTRVPAITLTPEGKKSPIATAVLEQITQVATQETIITPTSQAQATQADTETASPTIEPPVTPESKGKEIEVFTCPTNMQTEEKKVDGHTVIIITCQPAS